MSADRDASADTLGAYNIGDLRALAQKRLPKGLYDFLDRGTEDDVSLRRNREIFDHIRLVPRVLTDVSGRSQSISLLGKMQPMPIAISPTGTAGLTWFEGEIALARAAAGAGVPFTLATGSMTAMETVSEKVGGRLWFQLYMWPDRSLSERLVQRAKVAGFEGLVVTVDSAVSGNREYNLHNGFTVPFSVNRCNVVDVLRHPRWLFTVLLRYLATTGIPTYANYPVEVRQRITSLPMGRAMMLNDSLTWDDLRRLRDTWPGKLIVKGLIHPEDAALAADCGADAVVLSNHGGRTVDGVPAPIEMLPDVLSRVGSRLAVMVDSGFRRGSDIVKALALGADAVMIGRATLFGVAAAGEPGATRALTLLREEIDRVMALIGCRSVADLGYRHLTMTCPLERHLAPGARVRREIDETEEET